MLRRFDHIPSLLEEGSISVEDQFPPLKFVWGYSTDDNQIFANIRWPILVPPGINLKLLLLDVMGQIHQHAQTLFPHI